MTHTQKWPDTIWVVRHGESAGNVARDAAEAAGLATIDIPGIARDVDVPLSALGEVQAAALGRWFAALPVESQPTVVLSSPYLRARETAGIAMRAANLDMEDLSFRSDERLREKEFGVLDRLTKRGIQETYPEQFQLRAALGKFYHRPPGGESWCDVILRLRSIIDTLTRDHRHERVLIVSHQVVVNCFRYLFERMTEDEILIADRAADVPNCSVTSYRFHPELGRKGKLQRDLLNFVAPLEESGTPVTTKPDAPVAPK
jgi:broad specificity phosphatase PhoE